jgi:hypothetical protein
MDKRSFVVWVFGDKFEIMEKSAIDYRRGVYHRSFYKAAKLPTPCPQTRMLNPCAAARFVFLDYKYIHCSYYDPTTVRFLSLDTVKDDLH